MLKSLNQFNVKLIELVSQQPILYDNTAEGYTNFQQQDEIWRRIADELAEDVGPCKVKWKNIRSCYTRHLRLRSTSASHVAGKEYYLAKYLTFLLPFCKPRGYVNSDVFDESDIQYEDGVLLGNVEKTEPPDSDQSTSLEQFPESEADHGLNDDNMRKRKIAEDLPESDRKTRRRTDDEDQADLNFFQSILPDVRRMDGRQKNKLKIAILNAIDNILYKSMI